MGCLCSKVDKPKIRMYDCTPPGNDFDYLLKPKGTITFSVHRKGSIPVVDIMFYGWYENSVHLRPKHAEQREHFLLLERIPLQLVLVLLMTVVLILSFSRIKKKILRAKSTNPST